MFDLEPFFDRIRCTNGAPSPAHFRVGYRSPATRAVLVQIDVPAEIIERTVLNSLLIAPRITPDGTVTADLLGKDDLNSDSRLEIAAVPISELVTRAMAPENLRLEEAEISDLTGLQDLLEQSISKVRAAIAVAAKTT